MEVGMEWRAVREPFLAVAVVTMNANHEARDWNIVGNGWRDVVMDEHTENRRKGVICKCPEHRYIWSGDIRDL